MGCRRRNGRAILRRDVDGVVIERSRLAHEPNRWWWVSVAAVVSVAIVDSGRQI